ncbi:MAG: hypothetical protein ACK5FU_04125 [Bacteroidota bacterium]|jgi:hypothetical protein|nr:hypothetical protein [Sphingobacteriales bacterium]
MKIKINRVLILAFIIIVCGCKSQKCTNFNDPQKQYKAHYDKNGLIKNKNK